MANYLPIFNRNESEYKTEQEGLSIAYDGRSFGR